MGVARNYTPWCSVDGCERPGTFARGMCQAHYKQWRRNGKLEPIDAARGRRGTQETYPCGHPRTPENSHKAGRFTRCATCNREKARRAYARKKRREAA